MQVIVSTLMEMAKGISDAGSPTEIGRFDPGPLANRLRLSPVQIGQLRTRLGVSRRDDRSSTLDADSNAKGSALDGASCLHRRRSASTSTLAAADVSED